MPSKRCRDRLLEAILDQLWTQWSALGVAGVAGSEPSLIDPEALVLATSRFGRYDPRLFDEALDWLTRFSDALDVTRLRRLEAGTQVADRRVAAAMVDFMRRRSTAIKWESSARSLIAREDGAAYGGITPLFLDAEGIPIPALGEKDPLFLEHGIERPALKLRGMSTAPVLREPAVARLRLRALVGTGVRAEVLLYLATHDRAHGRLISARTGFAQRQVSEYLVELTKAGFTQRWEDGRTVQYRLDSKLAESVGPLAEYADWPAVWSIATTLWEAFGSDDTGTSSYAAAKKWRAALESVRATMPAEGLDLRIPEPEHHSGEAILGYAEEYVELVAGALSTPR